jgi:hypothetical protein
MPAGARLGEVDGLGIVGPKAASDVVGLALAVSIGRRVRTIHPAAIATTAAAISRRPHVFTRGWAAAADAFCCEILSGLCIVVMLPENRARTAAIVIGETYEQAVIRRVNRLNVILIVGKRRCHAAATQIFGGLRLELSIL